jgi:hypothetical protein
MLYQVAGLDRFPTMAAAIRYAETFNHKSVSFLAGKETVHICKDVFGVWRMKKGNR